MSLLEKIRTYRGRRLCLSECRFCAAKLDKKKLLDLTLQDNSLTYKKMISFLQLDVDISENNNLPKAICMECHKKCLVCYNFFLTVKATQEKFSLKYNNPERGMPEGWKGLKNRNPSSINTPLSSEQIPTNIICSHALEYMVCSPPLPNIREIHESHVEINLQNNTDNTSQPCTAQTYSNNLSNTNIKQTYMEPLQTVLDDESIQDDEFKMTFNAVSNDIAMNLDAIQNIDSEDMKPVLQNNVSEPEESRTNLRQDIAQNTHVTQNIDHAYCIQRGNKTNVEMKPVIQNITNINLDFEVRNLEETAQNTQPKNTNNTSQISVNKKIQKSKHYSKHDKNQYDMDAVFYNEDYDERNVKIEDISVEINANSVQLSETDKSLLPSNINVINDIPIDMEAVSSIDHVEIKSEIVNDIDSNMDNCNFETTSLAETNDLVCIDLDVSNYHGRIDTVEINTIENIELVERGIKTKIQNVEDCCEHNYDSDTSIQHFEEDNPLAPNENDTMTINNSVINEGSSQAQDITGIVPIIPSTNNSFSETLLDRTPDTIENLEQSKNIVETEVNNTSDVLAPLSDVNSIKVTDKNNERVKNVTLLNKCNSKIKYNSRNTFKNGKPHLFIKQNKPNDVILLNNRFSLASRYANPTNIGKTHKLTKINDKTTNTLRGTKVNNQNNVTILNKSYLTGAHHGHSINVGQVDKVTKENNVSLLKSSNSRVSDYGKTINTTEIDNSTTENNQIDCIAQVPKENNITLLNKNNPIVTHHGKTVNNDLKSNETNNQKDFLSVTVDGKTLLLQCSSDSEMSVTDKKGNGENDSILLNNDKATSNDKNIDHDDDNDDSSTIGNEGNLNNNEEPSKSDSNVVEKSKSITPWRFDHDDIAENDKTKTSILWKKKYVFNATLKSDIGKIVQHYAEVTAEKEILRIDPDNEYLVEKSWVTYPWRCVDCDALFDHVEDLRGHRQYVHKKCCGFWCSDCKNKFKLFREFVEHVRMHRHYLRLICVRCNQSFSDVSSCLNHTSTHQAPHKTCPNCDEVFPDGNQLRDHRSQYKVKSNVCQDKDTVVTVSGEAGMTWKDYEWRCLDCSKVERDIQSLRAHVRDVHKKCFAVKCADCSRDPHQTLRAFARHVRLHRPYLRHYCHYCDQHIPNFFDLTAHIDQHFCREYRCFRCGELYHDENLLRQHIKQYQTKNHKMALLCHFCGKQIKGYGNFRTHLRQHGHWSTIETCRICNKTFSYKTALMLHSKIHSDERPFSCDYCKMAFKTKNCIRKHILKHSEIRPYICIVCDKRFIRQFQLKQHSVSHNIIEWDEKKHICDYCGKTYKTRKGFTSHLVKHINNEKNEICKICDKRFLLKSGLRAHAKTHVTEKPYSCDYCQKTFKTKGNIRNHIKCHIDKKRHACLVCQKKFRLKCNLTVHVRTHTDSRPFHCEKCDRKFKDCSSCDKHMVNTHGLSFFRTKITERGRVEIDRRSGETKSLSVGDDAIAWLRNIMGGQRKAPTTSDVI